MAAISGKKTVTTAGTEVPLGTQAIGAPLMVKALAANTGIIYIGNDGAGAVANTTGLELAAGEVVVFQFVSHLANLMIDSSVNGEGVTWLILSV